MSNLKKNSMKRDLGEIKEVDFKELRKIWGPFEFEYKDSFYFFNKLYTDDGIEYIIKKNNEEKVFSKYEEAMNYLQELIINNDKGEFKMANHVSPFMHKEVNKHITTDPSGIRTKEQQSSDAFLLAKELMAALPLVPANEVLYNLVQDIQIGTFEDISTIEEAHRHWDAWKDRTKEILIGKGLLVKTSRLKKLNKNTNLNSKKEAKFNVEDIDVGDYVNFGEYGWLYICADYGDRFWVTDKISDRANPNVRGWYIRKKLAENIIEKYEDFLQNESGEEKDSQNKSQLNKKADVPSKNFWYEIYYKVEELDNNNVNVYDKDNNMRWKDISRNGFADIVKNMIMGK